MKGKIFDGVEESLLLAKTSVEKENQNMVPSCCSGGLYTHRLYGVQEPILLNL